VIAHIRPEESPSLLSSLVYPLLPSHRATFFIGPTSRLEYNRESCSWRHSIAMERWTLQSLTPSPKQSQFLGQKDGTLKEFATYPAGYEAAAVVVRSTLR